VDAADGRWIFLSNERGDAGTPVAGWLAGQIVQGTGFGLIGDIIIGVVGAFIASWLFPQLGLHLGAGIVAEIIAATIGAVLLLVIVRLVRRGGRW
jgi:uncharacterized membrane protein YeaQ/YmgE (transglycosylase-associated protein family)